MFKTRYLAQALRKKNERRIGYVGNSYASNLYIQRIIDTLSLSLFFSLQSSFSLVRTVHEWYTFKMTNDDSELKKDIYI